MRTFRCRKLGSLKYELVEADDAERAPDMFVYDHVRMADGDEIFVEVEDVRDSDTWECWHLLAVGLGQALGLLARKTTAKAAERYIRLRSRV